MNLIIDVVTYIYVDYFSKKVVKFFSSKVGEIIIGASVYLDYDNLNCRCYCVKKCFIKAGKQVIVYVVQEANRIQYMELIDKSKYDKQVQYWLKS